MLSSIITRLSSSDFDVQSLAADELQERGRAGLSVMEGIEAIRSATQKFPSRKYNFQDSSADLIWATARTPRPEYIPVVVEVFSHLSSAAKEAGLRLLNRLPQLEAAEALMTLVRNHARQGEIAELPVYELQSKPRHAQVFFPEILEYSDIKKFERNINLLLLNHLEKGHVEPNEVSWYGEAILEKYLAIEESLSSLQRSEGVGWMWEDSYRDLRSVASLYLELFGYFPSQPIRDALTRVLDFHDPQVKLFAVKSLIRNGESVDSPRLTEIAASAEMRNGLYYELVS